MLKIIRINKGGKIKIKNKKVRRISVIALEFTIK